ncbi:MAG: glucose 1-dehydrogenase [Erythrobacter sp.]|uniref:glucose 1-dehydrogenase n=1 Tax=Erythrobacter sp. TaxID=1042 RepID=UPI00261E0072|nr:glucose 1-dehydrogenase [Erythrobacter sp.]MDJ0979700.1 glucose 1-dehydrogenase [Erythrobacter sp.]
MPRSVLVTGGAAGIGLATARRFAALGDRVTILDRDGERARAVIEKLPGQHLAIACDVSSEAEVQKAVKRAEAECGPISGLVNNAGIVDPAGRGALEIAPESFEAILATNLEGSFLVAREAGRSMVARGQGAIVNVASLAGEIAIPGRTAYSASKAAVIGFTRALASEWAPEGVRVNAVLPGYVRTEIVDSLVENRKLDLANVEKRIPLGRLGRPEEIAAAIDHLVSEKASYSVGALLEVDGGYHAFGGTGDAAERSLREFPITDPGERHVVVTGGASGIGLSMARKFTDLGDRVTVIDKQSSLPEDLKATASGAPRLICADIGDETSACHAITKAVGEFGQIDVLINNAAVADRFVPTQDRTLDELRQTVGVNLSGTFWMARLAARSMIENGGGSIINLSSIAGVSGLPARPGYCASKSGVSMLTKSLACEWARHGIRVNAIAPGYIMTPGVAALEQAGVRDFDAIRARAPIGRLGEPDEIADAAMFLASPGASYITGTTYRVDGGWTAFGDTV